jgi:hypothetical protein
MQVNIIEVKYTLKNVIAYNKDSLLINLKDKSVTKIGYTCDKRVKSLSLTRA